MPTIDPKDFSTAIPVELRAQIEKLANDLLARYQVTAPPVPIENILRDPLLDLWDIDPSQMSSSFGHGIFRYAPRLAQARLLFRAIADSQAARAAGLNAPGPSSSREVKYFARCLLLPENWIKQLPANELSVEAISEKFQVPPFDVIVRLGELGLHVHDSSSPSV